MPPTRLVSRRGIPILMAVAMLVTFAPASASALTLQRTWSARIGANGVNGTIALKAYTSGVGTIGYSLRNLTHNATYSVQIRNGTCASLGSVVARPNAVVTSSTGTVSRTDVVYPWQMAAIWPAARRTSFVIRILLGTSVRCAAFSFNHATRVAVVGLGIDLPVIRGPSGYPYCRVAMYYAQAAQPREPGISFIFAHARTGMFLPLLTRYRIDGGRSLIGKTVEVWTSDSYVVYYRIDKVRKTTTPMTGVTSLARERLWLQTSTGPNTTYPKLVVEAYRYKTVKTTYAASHPTPHPISC
jgi:hypothetical protein